MTNDHWEYRLEVLHVTGKDDTAAARAEAASALNALGRDGWEAVGFSPSHASSHGLRVETTEHLVLLKRRRPARPTKPR
jgi:hypothetical protein